MIARLLALPVSEQENHLQRACAEEPALRDRLPEIMAALDAAKKAPPAEPPGGLSPESMTLALKLAMEVAPSETPGTRIGPYKLLQEIGLGGFGVVWMAEQETPIQRRVALKIIKAGMDTQEVITRFEAERQALALMDHPNIARVFDAGTTEGGRPFFVMELVRGIAITRYCDKNRLPAAARLRLFRSVCQAVQHAHQKGVIHRDLKPSNILVTMHDGVPVPKVIDFGIAKATSGVRLTDKTLFTQFHTFIGTPAYTSPEQMEMSGLDVDTRSDIYSLGVLLYELLTGRPPFNAEALVKSGLEAMRRTIREIDPPRPSHCLSTLPEADRTSVAQQRSTDAGRLSVLLRGDLDWIVMRCLEKDRTRRYETATGLARDIERHLANEPVSARPPSAAYQLRKFIRRHKLGVAAVTAVAVSLVAGLVVSSALLVRAIVAERAESRLRHEAETARELEKRRASQTALNLAGQLLEKGQTAEALAYYVHAARKDSGNTTIAPRLASVLASHNFLLPEGAPWQCGSRVLAMRFTGDGRSVLVGTADGAFRMFDSASGGLMREIHLGKPVMRGGWSFARDSDSCFAVRFTDNTVAIFDVGSGQPRWPPMLLEPAIRPEGDEWTLRRPAISLSPDGHWLAAVGHTEFRLWDAATGECEMRLSSADPFFGPDYSPDGRRLVLVVGDSMRIWSLPGCRPLSESVRIKRSSPPGLALLPRFSPDGKQIAVFDPYEGIHLFDAADGTRLRPVIKRDHIFPSLADFLPDGRAVVSGWHKTELLDLRSGEAITLAVGGEGHKSMSADGSRMLTTSDDGYVRLWNTRSGRLAAEPTLQHQEEPCAALSPTGSQMVVGSATGVIYRLRVGQGASRPLIPVRRLQVFSHLPFFPGLPARFLRFDDERATAIDIASGREVAGGFMYPRAQSSALRNPENLMFLFRPDFRFMIARSFNGRDPSEIWELSSNGELNVRLLQGDHGSPPGPIGVPFSPVGDLVAHVKLGGREIGVWDLHTGAEVGPGCSSNGEPIAVFPDIAFSADGKRIADGLENGTVAVWEIATGRQIRLLPTQSEGAIQEVHFSPDGTRLLALNCWHEIFLWDAATGELAGSVLRNMESTPIANGLTFSPDGRYYGVLGDHTVSIRDGHTNAPVSQMQVNGTLVLRFSPDGQRIVTTNTTGLAQVWDVSTGQPLTEPIKHDPVSLWLQGFSPDGQFVETISEGGKIHIWSIPPLLPVGGTTPEWLLALATICSTKKINDAEQCVDAPEVVTSIDSVRRELAMMPADAPLVAWGRWVLDDSPSRSIAPGFTITPAEADKLAAKPVATESLNEP